MKNIINFLIFVSFCSVFGSQQVSNSYQTWVTDPKFSVFPTLPIVAPDSEDAVCRAHSQLFIENLKNKTQWAVKMWDASAKSPDGVLSGVIFHYGNFDECIKIEAPIKVHYCLGHLVVNVSPKFHDLKEFSPTSSVWTHIAESRINPSKVPRDFLGWGLCLPASCKTSDIENAINTHLMSYSQQFYNETNFFIHIDDNFCTKKTDQIDFTPAEIAFWVVLFSLILLTASSTLMDVMPSEKDTKHSVLYKSWMLFSVKQNFARLVPLKKRTAAPLDALHGVKFASILFIVYGHRIGIGLSLSAINYDDVEDHFLEDHKMGFLHSDLVVDTFFFISGLLACYVLMGIFSKRFISPLSVIVVRIFRLAPLYFFVLWYQSTAAFRFGSGPLWNPLAKNETEYCVQNWWLNVLFINNYFKTEEMEGVLYSITRDQGSNPRGSVLFHWRITTPVKFNAHKNLQMDSLSATGFSKFRHYHTKTNVGVKTTVIPVVIGALGSSHFLNLCLILGTSTPAMVQEIALMGTAHILRKVEDDTLPIPILRMILEWNSRHLTTFVCMPHSWFLACELHFFTMATILVILLTKYPKVGRYVLGILTIIFILVPAVVIYMKKAQPFILFYYSFLAQPRKHEIFNILYIKSHNRAAVYFIGMCVGLYLHYKRDCKDKISMKLTLAGVAGWFLFMFAPAAYGSIYYDLNKTYNVFEAAIFGSLRRVSWAFAFTLFILAHRFGKIPFCNFILSSRLAVFLSRITYGIYLIHFSFVTSDILTNRTPVYFTVHDGIIIGMGDVAKAATATIVLFFILEIPLKRFFSEFLFAKKINEIQQPPEVQNVFTVRL